MKADNKLIRFAKISEAAALRVLQGFANGESVASMAESAGISVRTVRSLVLAVRHRLVRKRFHRWRILYQINSSLTGETEDNLQMRIYAHFAKCYFNRSCYSNFQQGLRQNRLCNSCYIEKIHLLDASLRNIVRYQIDFVWNFYDLIGIRGDNNLPPLTVFLLRYHHAHMVTKAIEAHRHAFSGAAPEANEGRIRHSALYFALVDELVSEPLTRTPPPISAFEASYGDLTWLD